MWTRPSNDPNENPNRTRAPNQDTERPKALTDLTNLTEQDSDLRCRYVRPKLRGYRDKHIVAVRGGYTYKGDARDMGMAEGCPEVRSRPRKLPSQDTDEKDPVRERC